MLRNTIYYKIKPLIHPSVRMAMRRFFALRKRDKIRHTWPVLPGSERPPRGWSGWPDGKQFAFVLTHDVEGSRGVSRCRALMELEMRLGFRSSFNFIPEGEYSLPADLRQDLSRNGFEIGVHDLHHDGKLYSSRQEFAAKATRIKQYMKEWGATGFRSGFMLHNLDWLHDLNAAYDASTFDTDPFEPQPDGVETIFPFWVSPPGANSVHNPRLQREKLNAEKSAGYVELPYTLPQDSTLFLVLGERHPDIWIEKLDWIAKHGGMALLNLHPDYLAFENAPVPYREFPAGFYSEFLEYVRTRYSGCYWQPLPRTMAEYCASIRPNRPTKQGRKICMISYSSYQSDNRVTRYAETLAERGDSVDVLALKRDRSQPDLERFGNVCVHRVQGRYTKNEKGKAGYLFPLLKFLLLSSFQLTRKQIRRRYDLIHIHNIPDFLVFAAWFPKLMGAKVILDVHDLVPEFYASKFKSKPDSTGFTTLKMVERASMAFADHVMISNHLWHKTVVSRSVQPRKCSVFINHVNQKIFYPRPECTRWENPIIMFPGGLQWHQGLDIAIRAMPLVLEHIPDAEFHIYGDGNMKDELIALAQELRLAEKVRFFNPLPVQKIAQVMAAADVGVVPKRADSFGNEAYSTKIMEFMSLGVPVVVSSTKIDRFYFNDSVVRFFESGNSQALAEAIVEMLQDGVLRRRIIANATEYADRNSWDRRKPDYLELIDSLIENRPVVASGANWTAQEERKPVENELALK